MRVLFALTFAASVSLAVLAKAALVAQWTFDTGSTDPAWTSDYAVAPPADIHDAGVYTIGTNANLAHFAWASYGPQGGDLMMICNGGISQGIEVVWTNSAPLVLAAGQAYEFSFYSANSYPVAMAPLQVNVSGLGDVGSAFTAAGVGVWQFNTVQFTAPATGDYTVRITNSDGQYTGNDFALDTIRMETIPEPISYGVLAGASLLAIRRRAR